jgi:hypothetical protein
VFCSRSGPVTVFDLQAASNALNIKILSMMPFRGAEGLDEDYREMHHRIIAPYKYSPENLLLVCLLWTSTSNDDNITTFKNWRAKYVVPILFKVSLSEKNYRQATNEYMFFLGPGTLQHCSQVVRRIWWRDFSRIRQ